MSNSPRAIGPSALVSPDELPGRIGHPVALAGGADWTDIALHRFNHAPGPLGGFPLRDHMLVSYAGTPAMIEERAGRGIVRRRWTERGHVSVIPAGKVVHRTLRGRTDLVKVHVAPRLIDEVIEEAFDRDPAGVTLVGNLPEPDAALDRLVGALLDEAALTSPGGRLLAESLARAFAVGMLRRHSNLAAPEPQHRETIASGRLRRVVAHMRDCAGENLSLASLAEVAGVSPSSFARAFREGFGQSPHQHLIAIRVEKAAHLLESTRLPIIEVALRCGFPNPTHFATMFRRIMGMSPRAYRRDRGRA